MKLIGVEKLKEDLISIIIPVYQVNNNYFEVCLKSIGEQTYSNIEVIIVNDGMTEENKQLVRKIYSPICKLENDRKKK